MFSVDDVTELIGFTACAGDDRTYSAHEIVLFEDELTNYGRYYNANASSFICPIDGLYMISLSISVQSSNSVIDVMRNAQKLSNAWARTDADLVEYASTTVVTECLTGDVVWARMDDSGTTSHAIRGYDDYCYTSFSGVLIQASWQ